MKCVVSYLPFSSSLTNAQKTFCFSVAFSLEACTLGNTYFKEQSEETRFSICTKSRSNPRVSNTRAVWRARVFCAARDAFLGILKHLR